MTVLNNTDAAGFGFNDETAATPVTGNTGTTIGAQRLIALQAAAQFWGDYLNNQIPIRVNALMMNSTGSSGDMQCNVGSGTLGYAGATANAFNATSVNLSNNVPGLPRDNTLYPVALAQELTNRSDLTPANEPYEIEATFNNSVGTPGCLSTFNWSYVIGAAAPAGQISFYDVSIHELAHGLGFSTFVNSNGQRPQFTVNGTPVILDDAFMIFLKDNSTGALWPDMKDDTERATSYTDNGDLVWDGPRVTAASDSLTSGKIGTKVKMYAPDPAEGGSSVSHFDVSLTPNEVMEPSAERNNIKTLTKALMCDIGWKAIGCTNTAGTVAISGTAETGQTLTATVTDTDGTSNASITYQWYRNGSPINGETSGTYIVQAADVGLPITVIATYTDDLGNAETPKSTAVTPTSPNANGSVAISGIANPGETLTANITDSNGTTNATITYQWKRNGANITGETGATYVQQAADIGQAITVTATYTDDSGTVEAPTSLAVTPTALAANGTVTISGTAQPGQTLTATVTDTNGTNSATITYQWKRGGANIAEATASTYVLQAADIGQAITVTATYTDDLGTAETPTSSPVTPTALPPNGTVAISGTAQPGQTLTAAVTDTNGTSNATITYQWKRGGSNIAGATTATYTVQAADIGQAITVTATYTDDLGTAETPTSSPVTPTALPPNGTVAVSGTAQPGQILTAAVTDTNGTSNATITYQWKRGGADISGATAATYTAQPIDVGQVITVTATYTDDLGTAETPTSPPVNVASLNANGSVSISGNTTFGQTLTATVSDTNGTSNATITYQWKANSTNISGATSSTYVLQASDVGKTITVTAVYTDDLGTSEAPTSAATATIAGLPANGSVTVTGTAQQGEILSAMVSDADGVNGSPTFQWFANGAPISGATGATYTLQQTDVGTTVTVTASYTDNNGTVESPTSIATATVAGADIAIANAVIGTGVAATVSVTGRADIDVPADTDGTNFGSVVVLTEDNIHNFIISDRSGTNQLINGVTIEEGNLLTGEGVPSSQLSGWSLLGIKNAWAVTSPDFTVSTQPTPNPIPANGSSNLSITFQASTTGTRLGTVIITFADDSEYRFIIQGVGLAQAASARNIPIFGPFGLALMLLGLLWLGGRYRRMISKTM